MKVKRGRPKKKKTPELDDITKEAIKGAHDNWDKKLATPPPTPDRLAFVNKVFHFKDGGTCTVIYAKCKDKPLNIKFMS